MKKLSSLDKAALGIVVVLLLFFGLVLLLAAQAGVRVTTNLSGDSQIGPLATITLKFSESVDPQLTESLLDTQPKIDGTYQWVDPQTLQIVPIGPFDLGTVYKLTLHSGAVTQSKHKLKNDKSWDFKVRTALVVYLNTQNDQSSIWAMDLKKDLSYALTDSSTKVVGFDTSHDGEFIVFYSANTKGGVDLWRVSRAGGDAAILLDCGLDRCTAPAISPDGTRVAYSREAAGPGPDLPYGSPRVWLLDLKSGKDGPVYENQQVLGYNPAWSPDGMRLASYDGIANQIHLLDVVSGEQLLFPSNTGGPVTWSPDSTKFLFTDAGQNQFGLRTRVRMADLDLNETYTLIGESDDHDFSYYSLSWSPVDNNVVLGMRINSDDPAQKFWLFDPSMLDGTVIADQPNYAYNSPCWDIWGAALVFQQFKLKGAFKPEIGLWKPGFQEPLVIAEGFMPHWLP